MLSDRHTTGMDIPDLVQRALGDEEIQAGVSLGDEDAVCLTPTRTLVYRGEGLLSDEQISEYSHDIEQLGVSEGRRKTKFTLQYIDGTDSFTVPANRGEKVLELFLEGVLRLEEVIEPRESILGVYRFSELTVIIAEGRLIKHIGEPVWNEDYEVYDFEDVTRLDFERASVATSIALSIDGRPQRIKIPNDTAPVVRQTLEKALFEYYDVGSLEELNRVVDDSTGGDAGDVDATGTTDDSDDFAFGDDFDPLVSDDDEADQTEAVDTGDPTDPVDTGDPTGGVDTQDPLAGAGESAESSGTDHGTEPTDAGAGTGTPSRDDRTANEPERTGASGTGSADVDTADSGTVREPGAEPSQRTEAEPSQRTEAEPSQRTEAEPSRTADPEPAREERSERSRRTADAAPADGIGRDGESGRSESGGERGRTERESTPAATGSAKPAVTREEFESVADRLEDLTEAVERQNELLRRQHRAIKQLVRQREEQ